MEAAIQAVSAFVSIGLMAAKRGKGAVYASTHIHPVGATQNQGVPFNRSYFYLDMKNEWQGGSMVNLLVNRLAPVDGTIVQIVAWFIMN